MPAQGSSDTVVPALSVVVPFFNEEENLEPLVAELVAALAALETSFEILLVDDGSTDNGLKVAVAIATRERAVRIIRQPARLGQSAALATGFARARAEVVVTLDADLQNDPADLRRLLAALDRGDVVSGIRVERRDSWVRRVSSRVANWARRALLDDGVTDVGCSLKAYRAEYLRGVAVFDGMHRFLPALLKVRGARIVEVPVNHRPRERGESKYGVHNRLWRGIADLFAVRWLQSRSLDITGAEEIET